MLVGAFLTSFSNTGWRLVKKPKKHVEKAQKVLLPRVS
jgi:hypothetical protein